MEKHNTHILLDSNSSSIHDYVKDENGNIKIDVNEDLAYNSFVEKKPKLSIKEILIENNNIFQREFEKNILSEEKHFKNQKKKKKKSKEIFIKPEEYRFNEGQIQPCFNEVELNYDKNKLTDSSYQQNNKNNLSYEIKKKNKKTEEEIINDKNQKKRNTMNLIDYKNKANKNKANLKGKKIEQKENNDYNNKEIIPSLEKKNEEISITDQNSEPILLKDKIQYQENESYNNHINKKNKEEEKKISNESISEDIKEKNESKIKDDNKNNNININPEVSDEKFLYELPIFNDSINFLFMDSNIYLFDNKTQKNI